MNVHVAGPMDAHNIQSRRRQVSSSPTLLDSFSGSSSNGTPQSYSLISSMGIFDAPPTLPFVSSRAMSLNL